VLFLLPAFLFYDHATLLGVNRLLSYPQFRKKILRKVKDPIVEAFCTREFAPLDKAEKALWVSPIQNKVRQFTTSLLMRNILGQTTSSVSLRRTMDEGASLSGTSRRGRSISGCGIEGNTPQLPTCGRFACVLLLFDGSRRTATQELQCHLRRLQDRSPACY
jgi:hypothetical protein